MYIRLYTVLTSKKQFIKCLSFSLFNPMANLWEGWIEFDGTLTGGSDNIRSNLVYFLLMASPQQTIQLLL